VEVTVYSGSRSYSDRRGFVKEVRDVEMAAGEGVLRFMDVPLKIDTATVLVRLLGGEPGDSSDFAVLEQNYEYDLISHVKLMEKYVGKTIKIMDKNEYADRADIIEAEVLGAPAADDGGAYFPVPEILDTSAGNGVYKIGGEIHLGHPGIKILPELPNSLVSRPTLSWKYRSGSGGSRLLEVSYITLDMDWSADYILVLGDGKSGSGLAGWVTVENNSGAEYKDAKLKLVAGKINIVPKGGGLDLKKRGGDFMLGGTVMNAEPPQFKRTQLFEYYIYDLERPTTLKNNQTKQIALMDAHGVAVEREYVTAVRFASANRYHATSIKQDVTAYLKFKNTKENNLGDPLPAGKVRIYAADASGREQYIGADSIGHVPKDEEIRLKAGQVFDIVADRAQTDYKEIAPQQAEMEWTVAIRNWKDEDVTVGVVEIVSLARSWEVIEASHEFTKVDAETLRFDVAVGSGQEVTVRYRIRAGY
jgi:hypothetical protein